MSVVVQQKASLGQRNGPEVELVVTGTELYATYETLDGYPAIYDESRGLFCFARLVDGELVSTGVPISAEKPPGLEQHAKESERVREEKIRRRESEREKKVGPAPRRERDR